MLTKGKLYPDLGSGGTHAACDTHKGQRVDLSPVHLHPASPEDPVSGAAVGRGRTEGARQACVSTYPGFPLSCSTVSGAPVTVIPSLKNNLQESPQRLTFEAHGMVMPIWELSVVGGPIWAPLGPVVSRALTGSYRAVC